MGKNTRIRSLKHNLATSWCTNHQNQWLQGSLQTHWCHRQHDLRLASGRRQRRMSRGQWRSLNGKGKAYSVPNLYSPLLKSYLLMVNICYSSLGERSLDSCWYRFMGSRLRASSIPRSVYPSDSLSGLDSPSRTSLILMSSHFSSSPFTIVHTNILKTQDITGWKGFLCDNRCLRFSLLFGLSEVRYVISNHRKYLPCTWSCTYFFMNFL